MVHVRDIPFNPTATPATIAAAQKWLVDNKSKFSSTANFAVFSEDGKGGHQIWPYIGQGCHASIQGNQATNRILVATECAADRMLGGKPRDVYFPFIRWLVKESYFSRFFLTDDVEWCAEYGFIISADVWTPLLQNICIVTRHFREFAISTFEKFNELVSKGVPGNLAFACCFTFVQPMDAYPVTYCGSGHRTTESFRLLSLDNFLRQELLTPLTTLTDPSLHYRHNRIYSGGNAIFKDINNAKYQTTRFDPRSVSIYTTFIDDLIGPNFHGFRDTLSEFRKQGVKSEVYTPPNPFSRPAPGTLPPPALKPNQMTFKELFECFVPWFVENFYNEDGSYKGMFNDDDNA